MMDRFSPDTILLPRTFSNLTYSRLISLLSENETWKRVAQSFGIFSNNDIQNFSWTRQPAETLVLELGARLCTIGFFCEVLKECDLYNILVLFKNHDPINIVEQPCNVGEDKMVVRGMQLILKCKATGLPLPKYQWYCNNEELAMQKESVLCINNFGLDNEGEYFCIVSQDGYENVKISNSLSVALAPEKPVILVQPPICTNCKIGTTISLAVSAKGHPIVRYQWFKGNMQISGSTEPELVLNIEDETADGTYRCYIYNAAGELWTNESVVTVNTSTGPEPSTKIALLIANQLYDNMNCLNTPQNDVRTLAQILRGLGFHTIAFQNLNLTEMRNALYYFADILPKNAYVVFYFSGHGFEICDKFMLPVNAPGPEHFLQTHAICERELLRAVLQSQPMLFLELLDMCLKPPDPSNKKILHEKTSLYEYKASHNLIQGYATTSYSGAYERKTEENGLYVKHLKEYLLKKKDMPIVEILRNVAKDIAKVCPIQKPFFGTNVTMDYRLTDQCVDNPEIGEKIKALSVIPPDFILPFKLVNVNSKVSLTPFLGVFLNTVEVRFSNLQDYKVSCEVPGEELRLELSRINGDAVVKIMNIQKLISNKTFTLHLHGNTGQYLDSAAWDIEKPMIGAINLQDKENLKTRVTSCEIPAEETVQL